MKHLVTGILIALIFAPTMAIVYAGGVLFSAVLEFIYDETTKGF